MQVITFIICIIQIFEYSQVFDSHYSKYLSIQLKPASHYSHRLASTHIILASHRAMQGLHFFLFEHALVYLFKLRQTVRPRCVNVERRVGSFLTSDHQTLDSS